MLSLSPSLLVEGLKVCQIPAATGWSENYVRWMIQRVYRTQGVKDQAASVRHMLGADALPRH